MRRLTLALLLCLAFPLPASASECSMLIGMSQIRDLYEGGVLPGWMLMWKSGATLDRWDQPHEWTGTSLRIVNSCGSDDQIDRVAFGFDPRNSGIISGSTWPGDLHEAIVIMETRYPNASISVFLLVGGNGHVVCQKQLAPRYGGGFVDVRASVIHRDYIGLMPSAVGTVATLGPDIDIPCSGYIDTVGHLTTAGKQDANQQFAAFYEG